MALHLAKGQADLQRRVFIAALFLVFAKLITATPFLFKHATDALAGRPTCPCLPAAVDANLHSLSGVF